MKLELKQGRVNGKLTTLLVSSTGRVFRNNLEEIKPCINNCGYLQLRVKFTDGTATTVQLGRLVLETFVDIPEELKDNRPEVDHKDYNRLNNNLANLRWLSHKDNSRSRRYSGRQVRKIII